MIRGISTFFTILVFSYYSQNNIGQIPSDNKPQKIDIFFTFDNQNLEANKKYFFEDSMYYMSISNFKFYMSNIKITHFNGAKVYAKSDKIQLIDFNPNPNDDNASVYANSDISLNLFSYIKDSCYLSFVIGVDSASSVSANFTESLDPTLGMYWAWNTGYIHLKMEGESNVIPSTNPKFIYHIGGYSGKFATQTYCSSRVFLPSSAKNNPYIKIDLKDYLCEMMKTTREKMVMIPGAKAKKFADNFPMLFH